MDLVKARNAFATKILGRKPTLYEKSITDEVYNHLFNNCNTNLNYKIEKGDKKDLLTKDGFLQKLVDMLLNVIHHGAKRLKMDRVSTWTEYGAARYEISKLKNAVPARA